MAKFRQKTKTINAEQWDGTEDHALKLGLVSYIVKERSASGWAIYKDGCYYFVSKSDWVISDGDNKKLMNDKDFVKRYELVSA